MATHAAVVLAAGQGTRMKSQTPKVLHPICGTAMVRHVVDTAAAAGLGPPLAVVPRGSELIRVCLGDTVSYAVQAEPLGSGHALLQAAQTLRDADNVTVLSADVPLIRPETIGRMIRRHQETEACVTILTSTRTNPDGLGRVVRSKSGSVAAIVEERDADDATLGLGEVNGGVYCFRGPWLWENLPDLAPSAGGEVYLTDLIARAAGQGLLVESVESDDTWETLGVNNRVQLAQAESALRKRIRERWMLHGVTMVDPESVYIDAAAEIGQDTRVLPNTHITGETHIGRDCEIGPNSVLSESVLGDGCAVVSSIVEQATLDDGVSVGPFSHVRPGSQLQQGVYIGNFAEVKNSRLGPGTKSGHFSYIGDAEVGSNVNVGAGTVTCNYDGEEKNKTVIGDDVFIGSDSMLVAPLEIGDRASTGAGSVVTKDVPADSLAVGAPARAMPKKKKKPQT